MVKDDDFKQLRGFGNGQRNGQTDISECRIAFATENQVYIMKNVKMIEKFQQLIGV